MAGLRVISNAEMVAEEEEAARKRAEEMQGQPVMLGLAAYVNSAWQAARDSRREVENRFLACLRACNGEYDEATTRAINEMGGTAIFMMLTDEKCTMAEAWLEEILLPSNEYAFGIEDSRDPDIPEQIRAQLEQRVKQEAIEAAKQEVVMMVQAGQFQYMQQAQQTFQERVQEVGAGLVAKVRGEIRKRAEEERSKLETAIQDEVDESEWESALKEAIPDITRYPAGFLKGPVIRSKRVMVWNGRQAETEEKLCVTWDSPSPWDIYPAPNATGIDDGYLIERHSLTRSGLQSLIGVEGYDEDAIREVLREHGQGGLGDWLYEANDTTRANLEARPREELSPDQKIDALQFWGSVQGVKLLEYGMDPEMIPDPVRDYPVELWLIGRWVIKCTFNPDPLGRKPYYKASFRDRKGSFWGLGLPELIADCQQACNASARNLVNNMAIASGPQVGVDISQLPAGEDIESLYPWKIWQVDRSRGGAASGAGTTPPVWFFQPDPFISELLKVYEFFSSEADTKSGIPKYAYGSNQGAKGALGTATGFSMMMNNATRGIKRVVRNIDFGIVRKSIQQLVEWLQLYRPEELLGYAGDIRVFARGSSALVAKEQQAVRRNEALQVVMNPAVLQVIGSDGFASMLRQVFEGLDIHDVVPDANEMAQRSRLESLAGMVQQQQQALPNQPETTPSGATQGGGEQALF
jgi:hypothetical protein